MVINWGTKIFMLYAGFVLLIATLIWKSTQTKFDLVSEDYYEQELVFQQKLNAQGATASLAMKPVVSMTETSLLVFFPQEFSGKPITADLKMYSPANAALDKSFNGLIAKEGKLQIAREQFAPARYTMQLSWNCEGRAYYQEFQLNLLGR